jgi:Domain of unknown function (DUF2703)
VKIEVLYVAGCPNHALALERLREVLSADGLEPRIHEILVKDAAMAQALKFRGSPTIRIDGDDFEDRDGGHDVGSKRETSGAFGVMCRLYSEGGGAPSQESLRAAIHKARDLGSDRG